ncbi:MAG: efflux transporter outer membrane subunit [Pseudomonadota bacterium]
MTVAKAGFVAGTAVLLGACATAPDYARPSATIPVAWQLEAPWRESTPGDTLAKGPWWERFGDPQLNALEQQAMAGNQTLAAANARLAQARATVAASSANLFPQLSLGLRAARQRISANRPLTNYNSPNFSTIQNDVAATLAVSYEVDLAGRVQDLVDGSKASAQQAAADLENTRLVLASDLAVNYFSLRALDTELDVLTRSIALQRRSLGLATDRHDLGATSGLDMAQQQALLDTTLTQVDVLKRQRSVFEHAIATLTGTPAPQFSLAPQIVPLRPPPIPLGIPSDVLERRPDVASAERAMAAANAQIGVATAAFYPSIILAPNVGVDSRFLRTLFDAPSLLWSFGVSATQAIFDGGRTRANVDFASAGYDVTVANYRRVVLTAMQEVEDGISGVAALDRAHTQALRAIDSNKRVLTIATDRYEGGVATYLDVITAQQSQLNSERQAAQLLGQRMLTSVFLIKALGGDWQGASSIASR